MALAAETCGQYVETTFVSVGEIAISCIHGYGTDARYDEYRRLNFFWCIDLWMSTSDMIPDLKCNEIFNNFSGNFCRDLGDYFKWSTANNYVFNAGELIHAPQGYDGPHTKYQSCSVTLVEMCNHTPFGSTIPTAPPTASTTAITDPPTTWPSELPSETDTTPKGLSPFSDEEVRALITLSNMTKSTLVELVDLNGNLLRDEYTPLIQRIRDILVRRFPEENVFLTDLEILQYLIIPDTPYDFGDAGDDSNAVIALTSRQSGLTREDCVGPWPFEDVGCMDQFISFGDATVEVIAKTISWQFSGRTYIYI